MSSLNVGIAEELHLTVEVNPSFMENVGLLLIGKAGGCGFFTVLKEVLAERIMGNSRRLGATFGQEPEPKDVVEQAAQWLVHW